MVFVYCLAVSHFSFGPQSGGVSWSGLPLMYDRVRVSVSDRCSSFLSCFEREGCRMLEMTCEAHDGRVALGRARQPRNGRSRTVQQRPRLTVHARSSRSSIAHNREALRQRLAQQTKDASVEPVFST
jgi:hypothetical protein